MRGFFAPGRMHARGWNPVRVQRNAIRSQYAATLCSGRMASRKVDLSEMVCDSRNVPGVQILNLLSVRSTEYLVTLRGRCNYMTVDPDQYKNILGSLIELPRSGTSEISRKLTLRFDVHLLPNLPPQTHPVLPFATIEGPHLISRIHVHFYPSTSEPFSIQDSR